MDLAVSLSCSQQPTFSLYYEPNPVYTFPFYIEVNFNIILPSITGFPKSSLSFRFPHHHAVYTLYFSSCVWHASPISSIGSLEWYLVSMYHGALHYAGFSSLVLLPPPQALYICLSTLFLNIPCLYYSLNVRNRVSHPYKTKRQGLLSTNSRTARLSC